MYTKTPPICGIDLLQNVESFKSKAYLDPGRIPTIAFGHTEGVKIGDECTRAQGGIWLAKDCAWAWAVVQKLIEVPLNQYQGGALLSFVFNIGEPEFEKSTLVKILNQGLYSQVPDQMKLYIKEKINGIETISPGLVNRRAKEISLWRTPV